VDVGSQGRPRAALLYGTFKFGALPEAKDLRDQVREVGRALFHFLRCANDGGCVFLDRTGEIVLATG